MRVESSNDEVHSVGEPIAVAAHAHDGALGDQRVELPLQRSSLLARNLEDADQLTSRRRVVNPLAHLAQQLVTTGHRRL